MERNEVQSERTPDQWKDYGDCAICRRKPYCHKVCRAHKNFQRLWARVLIEKLRGRLPNAT